MYPMHAHTFPLQSASTNHCYSCLPFWQWLPPCTPMKRSSCCYATDKCIFVLRSYLRFISKARVGRIRRWLQVSLGPQGVAIISSEESEMARSDVTWMDMTCILPASHWAVYGELWNKLTIAIFPNAYTWA